MSGSNVKKPDRRAYTFMIVPHRGVKTYSLSLPILTIKRLLAGLACLLLFLGGVQLHHMLIVWQAQDEQAELAQLRSQRASQEEKIHNLAKITESMQTEMTRVTQLENEVRRSLETEDSVVSRAGVDRELPGVPWRGRPTRKIDFQSVDEITVRAGQVREFALQKQAVLAALNEQLIERNAIRAATPSIWPASGEVTSRFGGRSSPNGIGSSSHKGLDIAGEYGSPVYATAEGVAEIASYYYGYGLYIEINHGYGLKTAYGHNSEILVKVGERIKKGQLIAYMGNSGLSTGTHLHYEVIKDGEAVNPERFL